MLNINKNQVQVGQKVVTTNELFIEGGEMLNSVDFSGLWKTKPQKLPANTNLTFTSKLNGGTLTVKDDNGKEYIAYWLTLKENSSLGGFSNLGSEIIEYVLYVNGKKYKKYKDIATMKASMMSMMGYHDKFAQIAQNYYDRCPENEYVEGYFSDSFTTLNRKDFKTIEIFEYVNKKIGNKVTSINSVDYYDEMMKYIAVSAQFGSAAREVYKKTKDTHSIILVYVPDEYRNQKYPDYQSIKEADDIKNALKSSGVKGTTKSTKFGKTAIAFLEKGDAMKVIRLLPKGTFYILNMEGEELEEKTELFVLNQSRVEKLKKLMQEIE